MKSDIFVLPSYSEGLPNSLVEAMSCMVAPIVTKVGSIPDYISHGENGLMVKPKSYRLLMSQIKLLLDDQKLIKKISINAFYSANKKFNQDNNLKKLDNLIVTLILQRKNRVPVL